ncbi:MAG: hypothetical protein ACHQIF_03120 [Steroidobacterales bacterium]|jgi:hypothetical protein
MIESHSAPGKGKASEPRPGGGGGGAAPDEAQREKVQKQLDEALAESFPASDPVSIVTSHEEEDWGDAKPSAEA